MQLLESEDKRLLNAIKNSEDIVRMVKNISEKEIDGEQEDDEDGTDGGEGEVVGLARKCAEVLGVGGKSALVEG